MDKSREENYITFWRGRDIIVARNGKGISIQYTVLVY